MTATLLLRYIIGGLAFGEFLGLVVFVAFYARSDWRSTDAGRTLMEYPAVLIAVFAATSVARFWPKIWLGWVVVGCHVLFLTVVWRRVHVLRRYQRRGKEQQDE